MPTSLLQKLSADIVRLHRDTEQLMLATQDADGVPDISHAPYVLNDGCYYALIVAPTAHAAHLRHAPQTAILLIEDTVQEEKLQLNVFNTLRLSWVVMARVIARSESCYEAVCAALEARCGQAWAVLKNMQDFHVCELRPQQGRLMMDGNQAYSLDARDLWSIAQGNQQAA